jgi:mRNA interferase MazF
VTRGEIYRVRMPARRGREHAGPRYAVIVQAEALLGLSAVILAPTSRSAARATFRPEIEVAGEKTRVLVEQLRAVDIDRLDADLCPTVKRSSLDSEGIRGEVSHSAGSAT